MEFGVLLLFLLFSRPLTDDRAIMAHSLPLILSNLQSPLPPTHPLFPFRQISILAADERFDGLAQFATGLENNLVMPVTVDYHVTPEKSEHRHPARWAGKNWH
jgi:hypothetical protein